ncbi:MAG: hypothetical protein GY822_16715 [Deltaproteobacteria bacterium]|nr:hypothetical protein [Deltaproteobacteria bacterium]
MPGLTHNLYEEGREIAVDSPIGVTVVEPADLAANQGAALPFKNLILVVDRKNHTLLVFAEFGAFGLHLAARIGTGTEGGADGALNAATFSFPRGVSFEPISGDIIVADGIDRLRRLRIDSFPAMFGGAFESRVTTIRDGTLGPDDGAARGFDGNPASPNYALLNRPRQMIPLPGSNEQHFLIADGLEGRLRLWENPPQRCLPALPGLHSVVGFPEGPADTFDDSDGKIARLTSF